MLFDFLNEYYTIYINDIFIYNQLKKKYEEYIKQMFIKLKKTNLQIDIKKSEFSIIYIKFLKFIIDIKKISMNPEKMRTIYE